MYHQEFPPPEALRDTIRCFWYNSRDFGEQPSDFEVMPDGYAEIIFHFGNPCYIAVNGQPQSLPPLFMMGLLNQPVILTTSGRFEIIAVRCYPWTVFDLLGLTSGNDSVRILEHPVAGLYPVLNTLVAAGKIAEAITHVQEYFLQARSQVAMDSMLFRAGVAMRKANGAMPVSEVAAAAHATMRTLERRFRKSSGYTVKDVSGLMRFEQVRNHLWLHPDTRLAGLAHELGYTDQAHLSREFKRYSGTTPAAFARKARKSRQHTSNNNFVAFIQA
ncbi:AraC family transcriptional regulator [Chitinophaga sp. Mgbs1]|uniref:AraC family transcriptional regulator n=1 Tax=Chitinophaga solisilvae TaxID=1233460 RepID=A0A433WEU8_9BACT|nr:AraC family transcriptional regulator [Chitinophaga solisilvae]